MGSGSSTAVEPFHHNRMRRNNRESQDDDDNQETHDYDDEERGDSDGVHEHRHENKKNRRKRKERHHGSGSTRHGIDMEEVTHERQEYSTSLGEQDHEGRERYWKLENQKSNSYGDQEREHEARSSSSSSKTSGGGSEARSLAHLNSINNRSKNRKRNLANGHLGTERNPFEIPSDSGSFVEEELDQQFPDRGREGHLSLSSKKQGKGLFQSNCNPRPVILRNNNLVPARNKRETEHSDDEEDRSIASLIVHTTDDPRVLTEQAIREIDQLLIEDGKERDKSVSFYETDLSRTRGQSVTETVPVRLLLSIIILNHF